MSRHVEPQPQENVRAHTSRAHDKEHPEQTIDTLFQAIAQILER